jgi:hypothetical protein
MGVEVKMFFVNFAMTVIMNPVFFAFWQKKKHGSL